MGDDEGGAAAAPSIACWMRASVSVSSALVASSKIRIGASEDGAGDGQPLALAAGERGAAVADDEAVAAGLPADEVRASASRAASTTSASLASDRPMRMFSAIERLKSPASWNTTATLLPERGRG